MTRALTKTIVIIRGAMECTAVIPECYVSLAWPSTTNSIRVLTNIVGTSPAEANLKIMVLLNPLVERLQDLSTLALTQLINALREVSNRKDRLPSRDGICSNNGVNSLELIANISGISSRFLVDLVMIRSRISCPQKPFARKRSSQALKELPIRIAISIIEFISRSPKGIATSGREFCKSQTRVISGILLELDIAVPACSALLSIITILDFVLEELNV